MNILVTGANGFIAKNLITTLKARDRKYNILECSRNTTSEELELYCKNADIVYHLAGVNRPKNDDEFIEGNVVFTQELVGFLEKAKNNCPIIFSSSIQAVHGNAYGKSKLKAEWELEKYAKKYGTTSYIFRLPNVFGKWCRPNYNSVVATFCYNIARGYSIRVDDENAELRLVYIDDVVDNMIRLLDEDNNTEDVVYKKVNPEYSTTVGQLARIIKRFRENDQKGYISNTSPDSLINYLFATYLSYLPPNELSYFPKMNMDERGSFTELFKTEFHGQVSINISKPGIVKGNHWHRTKNEKFVVVSGTGMIQLRRINSTEIIEYKVSGEKLQIIDIPPGYTHNILNLGDQDMITIMWCNECYDENRPDTYRLNV